MEQLRLQKFLAMAGVASRRKAETLIEEGKVKVNGKIVTEMGIKVNPKTDKVMYKNKRVVLSNQKVYYLLYKPEGYVTTTKDQFERPTVLDFFKKLSTRVYPVGRLDYATSGLLILTNDGDFAYKITHPKHEMKKTYRVVVKGHITPEALENLRKGVRIEGYKTAPAEAKLLETRKTRSVVELTIHEGKYRQVRKMFWEVDFPVQKLKRESIGNLELGELKEGEFRELTPAEVQSLIEK